MIVVVFFFFLIGQTYGQLYSYPAYRWKKKKRLAFMNTENRVNKPSEVETGESGKCSEEGGGHGINSHCNLG